MVDRSMRKVLLFCSFAALLLAGCSEKDGYELSGRVEGSSDGEFVYMRKFVDGDFVVTDSAEIAGQRFSFSGTADVPDVCYLVYENDESIYNAEVILENGDIDVLLGDSCSVSGTKENDRFQRLSAEVNGIQNKLDDIANSVYGISDQSEMEELEKEYKAKISELESCIRKYIDENISGVSGIYLLSEVRESLPFEDVKAWMARIPAELRNLGIVRYMEEELEFNRQIEQDKMIVDFVMDDMDGNKVSFADKVKEKKVTLVDFWASWCGPCIREVPNIKRIYKTYGDKDFQIIGVSLDEDAAAWKKAVKDKGLDWLQLSDLKGWKNEAARIYGVNSIPSLMVVAADGSILGSKLGAEEAENLIIEYLK